MNGIGNNLHRNNVEGSAYTVQKSLSYDHDENIKIIDEQAALERLRENNEYNLRDKKMNIDYEDIRAKNQREYMYTQARINIDKMDAESNAEVRRLQLNNQRNKDSELHTRELESLKNDHERRMKEIEGNNKSKERESERKMYETKQKYEIDFENARKKNDRE